MRMNTQKLPTFRDNTCWQFLIPIALVGFQYRSSCSSMQFNLHPDFFANTCDSTRFIIMGEGLLQQCPWVNASGVAITGAIRVNITNSYLGKMMLKNICFYCYFGYCKRIWFLNKVCVSNKKLEGNYEIG